MEKTACIFPGQGSQFVGMGRDLFDSFSVARDTFDVANDILGFDIASVCFNGPEDKLRQTRYTQLAILVHSVAVWRVLEGKGFKPDYVAGHSVGEYSALVASGALSYVDALRLVRVRAEAMQACGERRAGTMAAIIGLEGAKIDELKREAQKAGILEVANYNSSQQIVVSGEVEAVEKAEELATKLGAKRAIRLNVSGAFHSPLMEPAREELASALRTVSFSQAKIPVISNVTAEPVTEPERIAELLERQLTSPVLWYQSMKYLIDKGVGSFIELGPGKVLCGLLRRTSGDVRCISCSDAKTVNEVLKEVVI